MDPRRGTPYIAIKPNFPIAAKRVNHHGDFAGPYAGLFFLHLIPWLRELRKFAQPGARINFFRQSVKPSHAGCQTLHAPPMPTQPILNSAILWRTGTPRKIPGFSRLGEDLECVDYVTIPCLADVLAEFRRGADANVFWQIGSSATLGTGTAFAGTFSYSQASP